ncbi:Sarcosine oxidase beta subunit [hydrothermal vent metagenome]|uniref:Sarcosine oxidase beta subunit n=1 Tax=hydrothermal vent metagenome TaxID=652676 RepID=A0A3B0V530_9ZZZZ
MSLKLIRQAFASDQTPPPMWQAHDLEAHYDVVIIGGGGHGLACAYYLAKDHNITNVAVLEKSYIGSGGSGRNTAIVRSNYLTPAGTRFYEESLSLYEQMSAEFDFNVMLSQRKGHLTLAHNDGAMRTMRRRAEVNQLQGVESRVIETAEIKKLCPAIDVSDHPRFPIKGALYHSRGGIIRHDAVVWGYAHHADRMGVHIHQLTEVTDIDVQNGRVAGVQTNRGTIKTGMVLNATAGWCSLIGDMAGVKLPVTSFPLQAMVTEPLKPFLNVVIVSGSLHIYISQSGRGELVMGASVDPFSSYSMRGSLGFSEGMAGHILELFPSLGNVRVMRQWAGLCDMTPDYSQIMGFTPVTGFVVDVGWGTYGFKAIPASGKRMAELIATNRTPDLLHPFRLERFYENDPVGEKGAASVGT